RWHHGPVKLLVLLVCSPKTDPDVMRGNGPLGREDSMKRIRHRPEQIIKKLRDADGMLSAGRTIGAVGQAMAISEQTCCIAGGSSMEARRPRKPRGSERLRKRTSGSRSCLRSGTRQGDPKEACMGW